MTLKVRRILSSIFILLFLLAAPAIVLYAAGYKLSKNGFFIQKTGMFIIDSSPRGAKIFLNGRAQKTPLSSFFNKNNFIITPAKIKNLLPGDYDLTLELNGYSSWQKKLTINPGSSTFAEDVYLFKNDLPTLIAPAKVGAISLSPSENQALILSDGQITFIDLSQETKKSSARTDSKGKNIVWSPDGQKVVVDNYLYNLNDLDSGLDLNKSVSGAFNFKWEDKTLYFRDKSSIYRLGNNEQAKKIADNIQFDDFLVKDDYLYLSRPKLEPTIEVIELALNKSVKTFNLPVASGLAFINPEQDLLNLYDSDHNNLYLIDPWASPYSPSTDTINNLKTAFWSGRDNLLYANDYEIWLFNQPTRSRTLVTRISDTINHAILHPGNKYIIYATNQTINAIELDERQKRNITELVKFDLIDSLILSPRGDIIYFTGKIGNQEGLYKFSIQ